jgi:hypothetical protein
VTSPSNRRPGPTINSRLSEGETARSRRGSALVSVLLIGTILLAGLLALVAITHSGFAGATQDKTFQASLIEAEDISERVVLDVQFGPSTSDPEAFPEDAQLVFGTLEDDAGVAQQGYPDIDDFVANLLQDDPSADTVIRLYDADGAVVATQAEATFQVDIRSAYRHWRNADVEWVKADTPDPESDPPALPRVTSEDRASLVEPTLDYYEVTIDNAPGLDNQLAAAGATRLEPRRIQIIYKVDKPHFPGALYMSGGQVTLRGEAVIDGRDHSEVGVEDNFFVVPYSSNIELNEVPTGRAGYDSRLYYTDPTTGESVKIFESVKDIWRGADTGSVGSLFEDGDGNPITFAAGSPLDFYIEVKNYSEENVHHLFGHSYFDPDDDRDHGRSYGYAWDVSLELDPSVNRSALGQELWDHLGANHPDLQAGISDPGAFRQDPTGGDGIVSRLEDLNLDGATEVEDDVDGNGLVNRTHGDGSSWNPGSTSDSWTENPRDREDKNGNGARDDADRRLAIVVQEYIGALERAEPGQQYAKGLKLHMGFEDLPGSGREASGNIYGDPDWDYDDVLIVLDLIPNGDQEYDHPNPPSFLLEPGKPASVSGEAHASGTTTDERFHDDTSFGTINGYTAEEEQVRTAFGYLPSGALDDVYGEEAYLNQAHDAEVLLQGYLDTSDVKLVSDSRGLMSRLEAIDPDDGGAGEVIHVQNGGPGGSPVIIDGDVISRGVLIVDGDLELRDNAVIYGAVFVRGDLTISSSSDGRGAWVFGSVVSTSGAGSIALTGNAHIAYSSDAVQRTRAFEPVFSARLERAVWRRLR